MDFASDQCPTFVNFHKTQFDILQIGRAAILANNLFLSGTFSTTDPDNINHTPDRQTFKYTLLGDTAGIPFVIDGDALNSTRSLDYETQSSWNVTVQSRDNGNPAMSIVKTFQILVTGPCPCFCFCFCFCSSICH